MLNVFTKKNLLFFFVLLFFSTSVTAFEIEEERNFVLLTIPKCGTGLINKFFELASSKKKLSPLQWFPKYFPETPTSSFQVETLITKGITNKVFIDCKQNNMYPFGHFNFCKPFIEYIDANPDWKCVMQIRDLRDACISLVYWKEKEIETILGSNASFDEKLLFVIIASSNPEYTDRVFNLKASAERAVKLLDHPNVIVSRYEDLVGSMGGGSDKIQKQLIRKLCSELNIPMPENKLNSIASILWGNEEGPFKTQFRVGKIGKWKDIFKPKHKKAFKKYFGELLIELGYESDNNW